MVHRSKQKYYIQGLDYMNPVAAGDLGSWFQLQSVNGQLKVPVDSVITNFSIMIWQDQPMDVADVYLDTFVLEERITDPYTIQHQSDTLDIYGSLASEVMAYGAHNFAGFVDDEGYLLIRPNNSSVYEFTTMFRTGTVEEIFNVTRSWEIDKYVKAGTELVVLHQLDTHIGGVETSTTGSLGYLIVIELEALCLNERRR